MNHAGTVLSAFPLELPDGERLRLGEEMSFDGGTSTVEQYLGEMNRLIRDTELEKLDIPDEVFHALEQQRMLINVEKKRKALYDALSDAEALAPAREQNAESMTWFEREYRQYLRAEEVLKRCGVSRETLTAHKSEDYQVLAEINLKIKERRRWVKLGREIVDGHPQVLADVERTDGRGTHHDLERDPRV